MFLNNKYTKWYFNIIEKANKENRSKYKGVYYEEHHIIPRSLAGTDEYSNLVLLTAREHYICHLLLVKMVKTKAYQVKMTYAFFRFKGYGNSHLFERFKNEYSKTTRGENNPSYGKKWCHDYITKEIFYLLEDDIKTSQSLTLVLGLPFQRGGNHNNKWINDGEKERCIPKDTDIPEGWIIGKLTMPSNNHMVSMSAKRHTKEKDDEHRLKLKGRIQIEKDGKYKKIKPDDFSDYENDGWSHYKMKTIQKRFYEFKFEDGTIETFKNYRLFCEAHNVSYDICRRTGNDKIFKLVPCLKAVNRIAVEVLVNPRN